MTEIALIQSFFDENTSYIRERYGDRPGLAVSEKRDANDLLTEVDLTIQKRIVERIQKEFPGDAIVAEEGEYAKLPGAGRPGRTWVIDPIDGTNNFVRGFFPIFAVSIAFTNGGLAQAVGALFPIAGRVILAERGAGSFLDGGRCRVSAIAQAINARLEVDFGGPTERRRLLRQTGELMAASGQVRCHGSAVASICQIATGDMDAFVHATLHPWDYAAAQLIVEEAGGRSSRLDGSPLELFDGRKGVLITNGALHDEMLALIQK